MKILAMPILFASLAFALCACGKSTVMQGQVSEKLQITTSDGKTVQFDPGPATLTSEEPEAHSDQVFVTLKQRQTKARFAVSGILMANLLYNQKKSVLFDSKALHQNGLFAVGTTTARKHVDVLEKNTATCLCRIYDLVAKKNFFGEVTDVVREHERTAYGTYIQAGAGYIDSIVHDHVLELFSADHRLQARFKASESKELGFNNQFLRPSQPENEHRYAPKDCNWSIEDKKDYTHVESCSFHDI